MDMEQIRTSLMLLLVKVKAQLSYFCTRTSRALFTVLLPSVFFDVYSHTIVSQAREKIPL